MNTVHLISLTAANYDRWAMPLASVYVQCFAKAPWHEVFESEAVAARLGQALAQDDALLLAAVTADEAVGATLFYPLKQHAAVSSLVKLDFAIYCDELFVAPGRQRQGIGSRLFDTATGMTLAQGYRHRVLRTSVLNPDLQRFYASRGYQAVAHMQCSSLKLIEGRVQTQDDTRVVMIQGDNHV